MFGGTHYRDKKGRVKHLPDCTCLTCDRDIHHLGIMSHRAMHRRRKRELYHRVFGWSEGGIQVRGKGLKMGPLTRKMYESGSEELRRVLDDSAHVIVDPDMWKRCFEITKATWNSESVFEMRMPYQNTVIEIEGRYTISFRTGTSGIWLTFHDANQPYHRIMEFAICVIKGEANFKLSKRVEEWTSKNGGFDKWSLAMRQGVQPAQIADVLMNLMAEPRFVKRNPVARHVRRQYARETKRGVPDVWIQLAWEIGSEVKAKGNVAAACPMRAYHMVRAHWRYYDHETPKSETREGRDGFWVWIEATHRGHPALGEIRHHYKPRIGDVLKLKGEPNGKT